MFDHIGLRTTEFDRLKLFYEAALQPLALSVLAEYPGGAGFGRYGKPAFWIGESERAPSSVHVAFQAQSRADVDAFYAAAMNAGAVDNGAPGLRPHYHADYYGAFVLDPDGNNIEAVYHGPVTRSADAVTITRDDA